MQYAVRNGIPLKSDIIKKNLFLLFFPYTFCSCTTLVEMRIVAIKVNKIIPFPTFPSRKIYKIGRKYNIKYLMYACPTIRNLRNVMYTYELFGMT